MSEHAFLSHLREDHEKQKELGKKLVEAKTPEDRNRLRWEFYNALYPHMIGEEASMFERLTSAEDEEAREDAHEGLQEHHAGKLILKELVSMSSEGEVFKAKAKVLDEMNRHHIKEEEEDIFVHMQKLCSDEELSDLYERYEKAEKNAR